MDYKLKKPFPTITFQTMDGACHRAYGGNQHWYEAFMSKFRANRACGLIAAANNYAYQNLPDSDLNRETYDHLVKTLYPHLRPQINGLPTVRVMDRGVKWAAQAMGQEIETKTLVQGFWADPDLAADFIGQALEEDQPVLALTWLSPRVPFMRQHWVTITGLEEKDGKRICTCSTWGQKRTFDLDLWIRQCAPMKALWTGRYGGKQ